MNNDFKKAGYFAAFAIFIIGALALVASVAANYFAYDETVVAAGQFVSLLALLGLLIVCVSSKRNYNKACVKFAEYILSNRKKDAERKAKDAERAKEIQNMQAAAVQERESAVAAALEQGRSEGAAQTARAMQASGQSAYIQQVSPADEILYNEYGEPVLIRRRVRKQRPVSGEAVLYDKFGKPVAQQIKHPEQKQNSTEPVMDYGFPDELPIQSEFAKTAEANPSPQPISVDPYKTDK